MADGYEDLGLAQGKRGPFARERASLIARRGRSYRDKGLFAQALEAFSSAASTYPNDARHHLDQGVAHLKMGDYVAAQRALQRALALEPAQPAAWIKLGEAFSGQGQTEFALRAYRTALTFDPWSAPATQALIAAGHGTDVRFAATGASDVVGTQGSQIQALTQHITRLLEHLTTMKALSLEMVRRANDVDGLTSEVDELKVKITRTIDRLDDDSELTKSAIDYLQGATAKIEEQISTDARDSASLRAALEGRLAEAIRDQTATTDSQLEAMRRQQDERLTRLEGALAGQSVTIENGRRQEAALADQIERLSLRQDTLESQPAPATATDSSTTAFIAQAGEMLTYLTGRIEFVRRELLYEFHHGPRREQLGEDALRAPSKIVAQAKVDDQEAEGLKLNLGCGHILLDGYINVDRRELPGVDIVAEVDDIPLPVGSVAEIHSAHLLEHFPKEELVRKIIPYWRNLLRPGGVFSAVVPDGEAMMTQWVKGDYPFEDLREVMFGAQDYMGDYHYNLFTPDSLTKLLSEQGFENISVVEAGRRNGQCFELEIKATLSDSPTMNARTLPSRSAPTF